MAFTRQILLKRGMRYLVTYKLEEGSVQHKMVGDYRGCDATTGEYVFSLRPAWPPTVQVKKHNMVKFESAAGRACGVIE